MDAKQRQADQSQSFPDRPLSSKDGDDQSQSMESIITTPGLSIFEKKAMMVNRELDSMGMGRYQWMLWFLCGFGYFLDLFWSKALGLVVSRMQQEMGFSDPDLANIVVALYAGMCAGAFFWGVLVDVIGRYWAFTFTVALASVPGILLGVPNTYTPIVVLASLAGLGIGGNVPIDTTIMLEFIPQRRRWLLPLLSIFQPLGVMMACIISYAFIPNNSCSAGLKACSQTLAGQTCCRKENNMGWRYTLYTLGAITFAIFFARFALFRFQESPKWLLSKGRDEDAIKSLHYIARFNRQDCHLTNFDSLAAGLSNTSEDSDHPKIDIGAGALQRQATFKQKVRLELTRLKMLFGTFNMARLTILTWIIYAFDFWGFSIAGTFLPTVIARKDAMVKVPLRTTYRNYLLIYFPGVFGVVLGVVMWQTPRLGRQITMIISSALMAGSLFLFAAITTPASNIGFNTMEYFFQSLFNAVLYGWTPEAFPTPVRGTATGVASFFGGLFGIISPLIGGHLLESGVNNVLYLAGGGVFVCTIGACLLPHKTIGAESL